MKKFIALLSALAMLLETFCFFASAAEQPFERGTLGNELFRIPALLTLNDGTVMGAADMRHNSGSDAPDNLDTLVAFSKGGEWDYTVLNHFDDCLDGTSSSDSASFNDSAIVQSKATGRIFTLTSAFPSGCGAFKSSKGTGFIKDKNGVKRLALSKKAGNKKISSYKLYVGEFKDGFAPVVGAEGNYTVDTEYYLYLDGEPLYMKQLNSDKKVQQNVFFDGAVFHVFPTCYLWMRHSDDNGKTWSAPYLLNSSVKKDNETFLGVCPGRGAVTTVNGKERLLFCVYDNSTICERTSILYSDDDGETWQRSGRFSHKAGVGKTSEAQIINCPDGSLRIFVRNTSKYVGTGVSRDGGLTWSKIELDKNLPCTKNCMVSFINTSKAIDGKQVVLGSFACGGKDRKDGVIRTGLMDGSGNITWIKTYHLNEGFFAYSCMTELSDGKIACLYEDEAAHMVYRIFNICDDGEIKAEDGNDIQYTEKTGSSFLRLLVEFFERLFDFSSAC